MIYTFFASVVLFSIYAGGMTVPWVPVPNIVLESQGMNANPPSLVAEDGGAGAFDRTGWVFTSDSSETGFGIYNAMDDVANSYWHSQYTPTVDQFPHTITIDMKVTKYVDGFRYVPRQDGSSSGNIGQHKIYLSEDCANFGAPVSYGTWYDDQTSKDSAFETQPARCVRLVALSEAGNRGAWSSAAEFYVYGTNTYTAPDPTLGLWGPTIDFPLVPASIAINPGTGNIISWASFAYDRFGAGSGFTQTASWNPTTQVVSPRLVTETHHDMFCPGISMDTTGRVIITGGDTSPETSIYSGGADSVSFHLNFGDNC
jgi:galactose oxidase